MIYHPTSAWSRRRAPEGGRHGASSGQAFWGINEPPLPSEVHGIVYFDRLKRRRPQVRGIVTATRGNHGQSLAFAGTRAGIAVTIVVPHSSSTEKNAAMRSLGAELIEHGREFDDAKEHAAGIATERNLEYAPSFHRDFVVGVATYAFELFTAVVDLDSVYWPIGLGSGGVIGTRDLLDLNPIVNPTRAVGEPSRTEPTGALVDGGIRRVASQRCAYS